MKLGVNVINFGAGTSPDALLGWARFAERSGFSLAMISDHAAVTQDVADLYPEPFYEPFTAMAWLAGVTEHLELGTSVAIAPYRNPLLTARMTTAIDQFSKGRVVLGVGVGWSESEFAALNAPPFRRRGDVTDEYLATVKALWTSERATYEGEFVSFRDVYSGPPPVRRPHPPIWVGGSSRAGLRRAVTYGDAWHPINPRPGWLRTKGMPGLREEADAAGRDVPVLSPRIRANPGDTRRDDAERLTGEGTMSQILDDVADLADLGAEYVTLDTVLENPSLRRPLQEDWRLLEKVANALFDAGIAKPAVGSAT
ncbi:TIGR03619 family F420-dependent LLM class oxidoreductase [Actinopolymorpha rutila]|uniref:Putative F420-dependent oxidoreductase n=1 Tax=Actinopolymorpha rutila TaxID=446787 RepID=A0A852ZG89_9ACTN|nr:putative F420-dependent oxidoreductase [Actinopolymorpha rutila]